MRHDRQLEAAYITGIMPTVIRLQFDPLTSGKAVIVRAGKGLILDSSETILVGPTGECAVSVRLDDSLSRSHIIFSCEGLASTLPLMRVTPAVLEANKNADAKGRQ
jgi:hypothetical protein